MTACAPEDATGTACTTFTIAADGSYAARLAEAPQGERGLPERFPERWTLDGPEPYAVPLPGAQPEEADSQLLPLSDGRVLIARRSPRRYAFALLYPTGPGTGELPLGAVESESLCLLPPAPCGQRAYALAPAASTGREVTGVWLVAGSRSGRPEPAATVPGRCAGGAWLDREGRLLAVDRTDPESGITKTVVVDLARGGEVSPLLQITEGSNDRLLMADQDSGLLLVRSDAPGWDRLGWGVVGSHRPVRFPEALSLAGVRLTPFAMQPRQTLLPESCAIALCAEGGGTTWLAVWRPAFRTLRHVAAPEGWLTGHGLITPDGELRLPYVTGHTSCGLARLRAPDQERDPHPVGGAAVRDVTAVQQGGSTPLERENGTTADGSAPCGPVPLQQAPLPARSG